MANVLVDMGYRLVDELATPASHQVNLEIPDTTTIAELKAQWQTYAALLDAVTDGMIANGDVHIGVLPTGLKDAPAVGSRVEQTGVLNFSNASNNKRSGLAIPSLAGAVLSGGKINLLDTDIAALISALTGAVMSGKYANPFGLGFVSLMDAFLSFRKRRKPLRSESIEIA